MKIIFKHLFIIPIVLSFLFCINVSLASSPVVTDTLKADIAKQEYAFQNKVGFNPLANVGETMSVIIRGFLGLLAIIFIIAENKHCRVLNIQDIHKSWNSKYLRGRGVFSRKPDDRSIGIQQRNRTLSECIRGR